MEGQYGNLVGNIGSQRGDEPFLRTFLLWVYLPHESCNDLGRKVVKENRPSKEGLAKYPGEGFPAMAGSDSYGWSRADRQAGLRH